jgi:ElaB/YqjD/DUF883 family membrane-anchored ribosome-binding protein
MANVSADQLMDEISDAATQVRERATEFSRAAAKKADETRGFTADTLQDTADSMRHCGQASGDAITNLANESADKIESGARYVRANDFRGMVGDVVRQNPGVSMIAAVAAGFLIGAALAGRRS